MVTSPPLTLLITPAPFTKAMNSPDCELWWSAYRDEIENLHQNATFELVDLPPNCHEGVHATQQQAPVAQYENLHVLLTLATEHDFKVKVMDVEGAFLHKPDGGSQHQTTKGVQRS
jgi:hypothetical protein